PILNLTVSLKDHHSEDEFLNLSEFAETVIKKRIEQLPEIALADISGQAHTEIVVTPKINVLSSLGIENDELVSAIKNNNFDFGNLVIQNGIYQYNFRLSNDLTTKKDIEDIYINLHNKILQLKDLAVVKIRSKPEKGMVYSNNKRAVVLSIIKQSDAKVYDLKETLNELTVSFNKDYPNLVFETNQDQSELLKMSIDNLKSNMWMGIVLAILIMFMFLGDFQSPLISTISIPLSLILSMLMIYACGLSINIISLSGLILGCGLMIDNTIIVIENITQKIEKGNSVFEACVKGTNEVISPLISSTLTNCAVFVPLIFLSGIAGALFYDQAIAVTIGLVTSVIVSITIIPVLFFYIKNVKIKFLEKYI
ncbi:MAG: efflux RND transporter permease subunit, partial [Flavobacterium sp.]